MTKQLNTEKEIAYKDNTTSIERLPFSTVLYPGHYGTFFGFREKADSPIFLCGCTREAIENYIQLRVSDPVFIQTSRSGKQPILSDMDFPRALVNSLKYNKEIELLKLLRFENKLCHECNKVIPEYKYCIDMYGGAFKQNLGWYINKQAYEFGIQPIRMRVLKDRCPQEILDLIQLDLDETPLQYRNIILTDIEEAKKLWKKFTRQNQAIWNLIESEVRVKFGHKRVGEAWTSETILYNIICSLLQNRKILRHYRPDFLDGLELDIFIPELQVGIEYQGIQHFEPVTHWGGEEALRRLIDRDSRKRRLCQEAEVKLFYFKYDEDLSNQIVLARLRPFLTPSDKNNESQFV
jgi:hypothetical protein